MARNVVDGWTVPGFTHVQELGGGGGGRVMLAVDELTRTEVAIKYLGPALVGDEAFLSRFRGTARRLSQLEDPNVVDLYEFVEAPEGTAIVMERVQGLTLRRVLAAQGPTGPLAALSALSGTLLGLAAAHAKAVVHGTLRPSEILVDGEGNCRVVDFGLAAPGAEASTSPLYAAPELWDGAPPSISSDLYAAIAIFFECLTGHAPYGGRTQAAVAKGHREVEIPAEGVPGPMRDLIVRGLAKDPARRFPSAADLLGAVEDAAVEAYGATWLAQGRERLTELAAEAAAKPEPAPPKLPKPGKAARASRSADAPPPAPTPAQAPQPAPQPAQAPEPAAAAQSAAQPTAPQPTVVPQPAAAPSEGPATGGNGGGARRRVLLLGSIAAVLVVAAGVFGTVTVMGDEKSATPVATATTPPPSPAPSPAAALADRVAQAAARTPGAAFTYKRTGCCGGYTRADGTFGVRPQGPASYSMRVKGNGEARFTVATVVIGHTSYVRWKKKWSSSREDGPQRGYHELTAQTRQGSSLENLDALLRASTTFRRAGGGYQGTTPIAALERQPAVAPLYTQIRQMTGAADVSWTLRLDPQGRPMKLLVKAGKGKKSQTLDTAYSKWGRKKITAPAAGH